MKLLDNGWNIFIYKNLLGSYNAIAVAKGKSVDIAIDDYISYEEREDIPIHETIFDGPNRYCGEGFTIEQALEMLEEKVLFRRLPAK